MKAHHVKQGKRSLQLALEGQCTIHAVSRIKANEISEMAGKILSVHAKACERKDSQGDHEEGEPPEEFGS